MIVPSSKLLLYTALAGIPLFTLLGMAEAPMIVILAVLFFIVVLLAFDAPAALASLQNVRLETPRILRTSKGRELEISAAVINPGLKCKQLRVGLPFDKLLHCEFPILELPLINERSGIRWKLKAVERGNSLVTKAYLETPSPLGLWLGRKTLDIQTEVRIYPDLSQERNVLAPLFFRRGALGIHQVRQIGKGREFEQLRAYAPGDGYEDIYWKGTAKRRFPVTKMFQIERTQEIYVAIDCSRRSARKLDKLNDANEEVAGMVAKTQLERFIQAALVLALAAQQQSDKFGLIIFSDQVQRLIPAGSGNSHYEVIRDVLYTLQAGKVSPDYDELFIHIGNRLRQRALLIFLTDLGEPWLAESFVEGISLVSRKHLVLAHMLGQREVQPLFAKDDALSNDDDLYGKLAGQLMWNEVQETTKLLKQRGVHLTTSTQENLVADVVSEYLRIKKRQIL